MNIVKNKLGGVNDMDPEALERAKKVDLVTFDKDVSGTNCYNCKWIRNKTSEDGFCVNQKVLQYVNGHMCCALWSGKNEYRPYKRDKEFE